MLLFIVSLITFSLITVHLSPHFAIQISVCIFRFCPGYDTLPIDSMQGLDIGNGPASAAAGDPNNLGVAPNSPYGMDMDVGEIGAGELLEAMPSPPHDNSQVAAWYDTDL